MAMVGSPTDTAALTFEGFVSVLSATLQNDLGLVTPDTRMVEDLHWDSLAMLEALAMLGGDLPDELIAAGLVTLGDIHHYMCTRPQPLPVIEHPRVSPDQNWDGALVGPNVTLVALDASYTDWASRLFQHGTHHTRFRLRGVTPPPEAVQRFIWDQVLCQFVVTTHSGVPLGIVSCFDENFRHRFAHLAAVTDPARCGDGLVAEGMALLITYAFSQFDLRKLYLEALDVNFEQFKSGSDRVFRLEGRLVDHEYLDGRYHDLIIAALYRNEWPVHHERILRRPCPYI